jgi:hypothetical protein
MTLRKRPVAIRLVMRVFFVAGLLALGYATYVVIDATAYDAIEHRRLEQMAPHPAAQAEV